MKQIPKTEEPQRYEKRAFTDSKFVEIITDELFDIQMQYPLLKMVHAEPRCLVREEVYHKLVEASQKLPKGYKLRILDAWRPFALQQELYTAYSAAIIEEFKLEKCTEEQRKEVLRRFVSEPVDDREVPPVHTTGGAVDLTILNPDGIELDMGTGFDAFTDRTYTAYFEEAHLQTRDEGLVKENRRLLYGVMTEAGFTNLPSEWWHFDYGDRFWAYYNKKEALYRGVFTKEEVYGQI